MTDNKYYDTLELTRTATNEDIRKSYKRLAIKWHPDKNPGNIQEASEKFKEISEAYEILNDPEKRQKYDKFGVSGIGEHNTSFNHFNTMFQSMFTNTPFQQEQLQTDLKFDINIVLSLSYKGGTAKITYDRKSYCSSCNGFGSLDSTDHDCPTCNGSGTNTQTLRNGPFIQQIHTVCNSCKGSKHTEGYTQCPTCSGNKTENERVSEFFPIPKGTCPGDIITLYKKGSIMPKNKGTDRYNIILTIHDTPEESTITRHPSNPMNLVTKIDITLAEALCGFSRTITHLDDNKIDISCKDICSPDHTIISVGHGMIKDTTQGDLLINIKITFPSFIPFKKTLWELLENSPYIDRENSPTIYIQKTSDIQSTNDKETNEQKGPECKQM